MTLSRTFIIGLVCLLTLGCGPSKDVREVEERAEALVANRASTNDVSAAFGRAPSHIYLRAEVQKYFDETARSDESVRAFWQRMLQYPETHTFPMPGGQIQIFFDESRRAAGFYSNIQL